MKKLLFCGLIVFSIYGTAFGMSSSNSSSKSSKNIDSGSNVMNKGIKTKFHALKKLAAIIIESDLLKYFSPREIAIIREIEFVNLKDEKILTVVTEKDVELKKENVYLCKNNCINKEELDFFVFGERD